MMIDGKITTYKKKIYTAIAIFGIVVVQSLFLIYFVSNEDKKVNNIMQEAKSRIEKTKYQINHLESNIVEFAQLQDIWLDIDKKKIKPTNYSDNDIIIFLNSNAKKFGISNLVVDIKEEKKDTHYNTVIANLKFSAFNEPAIFLFLKTLETLPDCQIFINSIEINKSLRSQKFVFIKVTSAEYRKSFIEKIQALYNGSRFEALPDFLMIDLTIEILLVH